LGLNAHGGRDVVRELIKAEHVRELLSSLE
jgi:hypothetical protein